MHGVREGSCGGPLGQSRLFWTGDPSRPLTLVEALADIYEVVIVWTGRVGINSTLPLLWRRACSPS